METSTAEAAPLETLETLEMVELALVELLTVVLETEVDDGKAVVEL